MLEVGIFILCHWSGALVFILYYQVVSVIIFLFEVWLYKIFLHGICEYAGKELQLIIKSLIIVQRQIIQYVVASLLTQTITINQIRLCLVTKASGTCYQEMRISQIYIS